MSEETVPEEGSLPRIKVVYTRSRDYRTIHATGIFGGLTPRGEISCHLFAEGPPIPEGGSIEVDVEGDRAGEVLDLPPAVVEGGFQGVMEREVQVRVVFPPEQAKSISDWFAQRFEEWQAARRAADSGDDTEEGDGDED